MATNLKDEDLSIEVAGLRLACDGQSGHLRELSFGGQPLINLGAQTGAGFALRVDGFSAEPRLLPAHAQDWAGGRELVVDYELDDGTEQQPSTRRYVVTQTFRLSADPLSLERRVSVKRFSTGDLTGADVDKLRSVTLVLAGVAAGDPLGTTVSAPMARILPGSALSEMRQRLRYFRKGDYGGQLDVCISAHDGIPACFTWSRADELHVSVVPLLPKIATLLRVFGQGSGVTVEQEFCCSTWMDYNTRLEAAAQIILVHPAGWREAIPTTGRSAEELLKPSGWRDALPATGRKLGELFKPVTDSPDWVHNAIIYEAEPKFIGGFKGLTQKLDMIQSLGVNTVYLMPWQKLGYGNYDYYTLDDTFGTLDELKAAVKAAHDRGLKFMFDLLVSMMNVQAPLAREHPEFFYQGEGGHLRPHVTWGGLGFDCAHPGFRKYLIDYACWCVREFGCDGFRVDADAYRGGYWKNLPGLQPHDHSYAVFSLLDEIRQAIRRINPQAILMAETWGPIQTAITDLVCYQWLFAVDWAMSQLADGKMRGADFQRWIAEQTMAMPPGTRLAYYSHTHDSLAFLKRDVRGPLACAFFASLAFLGQGVMFFGGGWKMEERPEPDEVDQYQRMFALRTQFAGFRDYTTEFPPSPDPDLFIYDKVKAPARLRFITNFSAHPKRLPAEGELRFSRCQTSRIENGDLLVQPYDTVILENRG